MKIDVYNQKGEKKGQMELPSEIFEQEASEGLIHSSLIRQLSNGRQSPAHTKTKGEVSGGGAKPWRQKGTGRARQGSRRNPHWRGGGVAFGPRNDRNYTKLMPQKMRQKALFGILSARAKENKVIAIDTYTADAPRTKDFAQLMKKLPVQRKTLIIIPEKNHVIQKSTSNLPNVKTIIVNYLNPADLLSCTSLLFFEEAIVKLPEIFRSYIGKKQAEPKPKQGKK